MEETYVLSFSFCCIQTELPIQHLIVRTVHPNRANKLTFCKTNQWKADVWWSKLLKQTQVPPPPPPALASELNSAYSVMNDACRCRNNQPGFWSIYRSIILSTPSSPLVGLVIQGRSFNLAWLLFVAFVAMSWASSHAFLCPCVSRLSTSSLLLTRPPPTVCTCFQF